MLTTHQSHIIANRYQLHQQLGQGAMGMVYRATDRLTGKTIALKQITLETEKLQFASRQPDDNPAALRLALATEFRTLAGLRHPHIISVIDYGFDHQRQPYFTMDYLPNPQTILQAGEDRSAQEIVQLLIQILQALVYLHRRDILHRDIKPANVLVSNGRVRVLDFGLAASLSEAKGRAGTLVYMAPETLKTGQWLQASDLYAVGVLAFQLFSGELPFQAADIMGIMSGYPDFSKLAVSPSLLKVIAILLEKDPAERYPNAMAVIQALSKAVGLPAPDESAIIRESFLQAAKFVGRETQYGRLMDGLERATQGQGSSWLVGGESGVGKSRLLDELRIQAVVSGAVVLRGQAVEGGGQPYQLWREPLRHLTLLVTLSDLQAGVIKPLVPDIENLIGRTIPTPPELDEQAAQQRLHLTIAEICQAAASNSAPLVLLLDDLQWATESLEPLKAIHRLVKNSAILMIGSYRSEERPTLPDELPVAFTISLPRLTSAQIAQLSASMLGTAGEMPQVLNLLETETDGNTFFLVEVVRALAEDAGRLDAIGQMTLPAEVFAGGIQRILQRRLARAPEACFALLKPAAISGRILDLDVLRAMIRHQNFSFPSELTDRNADWLESWLTTCANIAILEVQEGQWRFTHDKLRTELLNAISQTERPALHRQVAEAYAAVYADAPDYAALLSVHWEAAGEAEKAIHSARIAGDHAAAQFIHQDAIHFYTKALALIHTDRLDESFDLRLARLDIYDRLGQRTEQAADFEVLKTLAQTPAQKTRLALREAAYHNCLGEHDAASQMAEQALRWAAEQGDLGEQSQSLLILAQAQQRQGNYKTAAQTYRRVFEFAPPGEDQAQIPQVWNGLGEVAYNQGDYPTAASHHQRALEMQQAMGDLPGQVTSLRSLGQVAGAQGDYETARGHYLTALDLARQMGDRPEEARLLLSLGEADWRQGQYTRAETYLQPSLALAQTVGDRHTAAAAFKHLGTAALFQGHYDAASEHYQHGQEIACEIGNRTEESAILTNLGITATLQGQLARANEYYLESLTLARELGDRAGEGTTLSNLATNESLLKRYAKAGIYYQESLAISREIGNRSNECSTLAALGDTAYMQGDYDQSFSYAEQSLDIAKRIGNRYIEGRDLQLLGSIAAQRHHYEVAQEYYEQSLAIARASNIHLDVAVILDNLGVLTLAQRDFRKASLYFEEALDIRTEHEQTHLLPQSWAGLALAALRRGDSETAQTYAAKLLAAWADDPTFQSATQPIRVFHFTWQVCRALGLPQAEAVLASVIEEIQAYLAEHPAPEAHAMYLAQPHHRALWDAWHNIPD